MYRAYLTPRTALKLVLSLAILALFAPPLQAQRFVKVVDTIDQLVRLNPTDVHTNVFVADPERGGMFTLAARTATNAGTVLASTNATKQWNRQYRGPISPLWFGASSNLVDNSVPIQAALDYMRTNRGQIAFPPAYRFPMTNEINIEHSVAEPAQQKLLLDFNGSHLDWSGSPMTTGSAFDIAGPSIGSAELGIVEIKNLHMTGPEPESPVNVTVNDNQTTLIGMRIGSLVQVTMDNVLIRLWYKGLQVAGAFPTTYYNLRTRDCFIGLHLEDYAINQHFLNFEAHQCGYGVLMQVADANARQENIRFTMPRIENCYVGFTVDPLDTTGIDVAVKGLTIENSYMAQNEWDHFRLGLAFNYSTPETRGAARNRLLVNTIMQNGKWTGPYTTNNQPLVFGDNSRVRGGWFVVPCNETNIVNSTTTRSNVFIWPLGDQDNPQVADLKMPAGSSIYIQEGKLMVGNPGEPEAQIHVKQNSDTNEAFVIIEDTDDTAGSHTPNIQFKGNGAQTGKLQVGSSAFNFNVADDSTKMNLSQLGNLSLDGSMLVGAIGVPLARLHVKQHSSISEDFVIIEDTDTGVGSMIPSIAFYGGGGFLARLTYSDTAGWLFRDASDTTAFTINTGYHFRWTTDNASDIGADGANRPRNVYVGTDVRVGALTPARVVVSDAERDLASSAITTTELGYLTGLGTNLTTHLQLKQDAFTTGNGVTNIANVLSGTYQAGTNIVFVTNSTGVQINSSAAATDTDGYTLLPIVTTIDNTETPIFTNTVPAGSMSTIDADIQILEDAFGGAKQYKITFSAIRDAGANIVTEIKSFPVDAALATYENLTVDTLGVTGSPNHVVTVQNNTGSGTYKWRMRYKVQTLTY